MKDKNRSKDYGDSKIRKECSEETKYEGSQVKEGRGGGEGKRNVEVSQERNRFKSLSRLINGGQINDIQIRT